MSTHQFSGRLIDKFASVPAFRCRIEAIDCARLVTVPVATDWSDREGNFVLTITDETLRRLFGSKRPTLFFRVINDNSVLVETDRTQHWVPQGRSSGVIEIDSGAAPIRTDAGEATHVVKGVVVDTKGDPLDLEAFTVELRLRDITSTGVGHETIGSDNLGPVDRGHFSISYPGPGGAASPYGEVELRVLGGEEEVLASRILRNPPAVAVVDLVVGGGEDAENLGRTEYGKLSELISLAVAATDPVVGIDALNEAQVEFLVSSTKQPIARIQRLVGAVKLAEAHSGVPAEVFYALLSRGVAPEDVFDQPLSSVRDTLVEAARARRIAPSVEQEIEAIIDDFETAAVAELAVVGATGTREYTPVGQLAALTPGVDSTKRDAFIRHHLRNEGTTEDFWTAVAEDSGNFSGPLVASLKFSADVAAVVSGWPAMITALHTERTATEIAVGRDLAKYTEADWLDFIGTTGRPPGAASDAAYAQSILARVEQRYRTAFIGFRQTGDVLTFFEDNPEFDFETTRVARYLAEHDTVLDGLDAELVTSTLKTHSRLFKVTSNYAEMSELMSATPAYTSSHAIHLAGPAGLAANTSLTSDQINSVISRACWVSWGAMALHAKHSAGLEPFTFAQTGILPNLAVSSVALPTAIADWEELFGTLDQCACDHCRSVLSPSAYLVDVLQFMSRVQADGTDARERLFLRRPDIERLALSCENADTALPYVDLVNEILEVYVATQFAPFPTDPSAIQTARTTSELQAQPEVFYPAEYVAAYTDLATGLHPFSMPFHLWAKEARVYLDHIGVSRATLVEKLAPQTAGPDPEALAIERLDIAPMQYDILAGTVEGGPEPYEYWGFPASPTPSPAYDTQLKAVPAFMGRSGLSYDELCELLATKLSVDAGVTFDNPTCVLDDLELSAGVDAAWLEEAHKLLRMRGFMGLSITDAGKVQDALGADWEVLTRTVGGIKMLHERTKIPYLELLAWFSNIDRWPGTTSVASTGFAPAPSLFEKLFLNKAVVNPDEAALREVLNPSIGSDDAELAERAMGLLPGLRIGQADFDLLTSANAVAEDLVLEPEVPVASQVDTTIENVSRLFRLVSQARAAKLRVHDYLVLRALSGTQSLAGDGAVAVDVLAQSSLDFLDTAALVASTGATLDEIHYVTRHVAPKGSSLEPSAAQQTQWQDELDALVKQAQQQAANIVDPDGDPTDQPGLLETLVVQLIPSADRAAVLQLAADDVALDETERNTLITGALAPFIDDTDEASEKLAGPSQTLTVVADRRAYLASQLQRASLSAGAVKTWAANTFGLATDIVDYLLTGENLLYSAPGIFTLTRLTTWTEPTPTTDKRTALVLRLQKAALLAKRFNWTLADLQALFPAVGGLPSLDLSTLPVERPTNISDLGDAQDRFAIWLRYAAIAKLRDRWAEGRESFYAFFAAAAETPTPLAPELEALDIALAAGSRFALEDVIALRDQFDVGLTDASGYADERVMTRIFDAMMLVNRLGVSATRAIAWATPVYNLPTDIDEPTGSLAVALDIKRVAKSKHSNEDWAEIARPLRDVLRERQRATLVDRACALNGFGTKPNDLYRKLLIDVEMSPCQLTSRTVLAHGAAQLLMHRILLQLEGTLVADEDRAREWQWMKTYRVWEANRKVFLWPENWIEPELRDDKSPLFNELETKLRQGPLDNDRAEDAYRAYLEGLSDISNLQILAIHEEDPTPPQFPIQTKEQETLVGRDQRTLHVFAKSRRSSKHYHRTRRLGLWTPWEKLDVDVDSEHLMPVSLDGRLYLFWPQWTTLAADDLAPLEDVQPDQHGVRLAYSERRVSGWTPPTFPKLDSSSGGAPVDYLSLGGAYDVEQYGFLAFPEDGIIRIQFHAWWLYDPSEAATIAQFRFDPADGSMQATLKHKLTPGQDYVDFVADHPGDLVVAPPDSTLVHYQAFRRNPQYNATFKVLMLPDNSNSAAMTKLFDKSFTDYLAYSDRRNEPHIVRTPWLFSSGGRTILLDYKLKKTFIINAAAPKKKRSWNTAITTSEFTESRYRASVLYHPFVKSFRKALGEDGINGLLRWADQDPKLQNQSNDIEDEFEPMAGNVELPFPLETVDFTLPGAYSVYNWELFFHIPLLIAQRLSAEGRYAEAQRWFHFIFDPTDGSSGAAPKRFWKVKPFRENENLATIQDDLNSLSLGQYVEEMAAWALSDSVTPASDSLVAQIQTLHDDPFDPHAIAKLRVSAYQKTTVIKYIENLIAWGDNLFAQDSIESINEATQLYILAAELLGDRPDFIHDATPVEPETYGSLDDLLDEFSNAIIEIETAVPEPPAGNGIGCKSGALPPEIIAGTTYFCVPPNEKLLGLWDLVADRLFKIRHCMSIEGTVRSLPLFQPPIDPALLVRATAAGLDISSVVNEINVAAPPYRFTVLQSKAQEFVSSVVGLGASFLSTLEKQDAEALSLMRSRHETSINEMMREVRKDQVREARQNLSTLDQSLRSAQARADYFGSRKRIYPGEQDAIDLLDDAHTATMVSGGIRTGAAIAMAFGNEIVGMPVAAKQIGGGFFGAAGEIGGGVADMLAQQRGHEASMLDRSESYARRKEDWDHQAGLALIEVAQVEKEILAAKIRLEIADRELLVLERQIEQSREMDVFLRGKFTSEQLYGWMQDQLGALHYQAYKLAFEMARRAEKAFQYERGDLTQTFVNFGSWEGLRRGLLAGERLAHDLRRMDAAYLAQNKRELELTKMVSLSEHDPRELVKLRDGQAANILLTEDDYDRDFPGHYMRRLKSLGATVQCTTGPYQGVLGTLTTLKGETRRSNGGAFSTTPGAVQSIVTSHGQVDSGLFELQFRDERLLPFEGVGAHAASGSQLRFELSGGNRFNYDTIDDLVLDVRYTARAGSEREIPEAGRAFSRLVRVRDEFPTEWRAFKAGELTTISMALPRQSFVLSVDERKKLDDEELEFAVTGAALEGYFDAEQTVGAASLVAPTGPTTWTLSGGATSSARGSWTGAGAGGDPGTFVLSFADLTSGERASMRDLWLILDYEVVAPTP